MTTTAHVINVAGQTARMAHMADSLSTLGLVCNRIAAVTLDEAAGRTGVDPARTALNPAELACYASHMRAWQAIANGTDDWGLVLEDDVIFAADARVGIDHGVTHGTGAIVRLEHWGAKKAVLRLRSTPVAGQGFHLLDYRDGFVGAAAYLLSRAGAAALLRRDHAFDRPLDRVLFNPSLPDVPVQVLWPAVAIQSDRIGLHGLKGHPAWGRSDLPVFGSTLDHRDAAQPKPVAARVAAELRHVWRGVKMRMTGHRRVAVPLSAAGPLCLRDQACDSHARRNDASPALASTSSAT